MSPKRDTAPPMYATRDTRIKTDKRDARALCDACRLGAYHPLHRTSDAQRDVWAHLDLREALLRTRAKYISLISALARQEGYSIIRGTSATFAARVVQAQLPSHVLMQIEPRVRPLCQLKQRGRARLHNLYPPGAVGSGILRPT